MRKLVYFVASSLDGFIAGPDGDWSFFPFSAESDLARIVREEFPETLPTAFRQALGFDDAPNRRFDTVLMGRATYEPALKQGITSPYAHLRQVVYSSTLTEQDPTVEIVPSDPTAHVRTLKSEPGPDLWLCGGGALAGALWPEVDELIVKLNPVTAGQGIKLADRDFDPTRLTLISATPTEDGVVLLHYTRQA
jgi:dihydrofolate reductase